MGKSKWMSTGSKVQKIHGCIQEVDEKLRTEHHRTIDLSFENEDPALSCSETLACALIGVILAKFCIDAAVDKKGNHSAIPMA